VDGKACSFETALIPQVERPDFVCLFVFFSNRFSQANGSMLWLGLEWFVFFVQTSFLQCLFSKKTFEKDSWSSLFVCVCVCVCVCVI